MKKIIKLTCFVLIMASCYLVYTACAAKDGTASGNTAAANGDDSGANSNVMRYKDVKQPYDEERANSYLGKQASFDYELKDSYSSRDELKYELQTLVYCYDAWRDGKGFPDDFNSDPNYLKYQALDNTLREMLKKFPPDEEEITQDKVNRFYSRIGLIEQDVMFAQDKIEGFDLEKYTVELEAAKKVQAEYEAGKITIDEARKRLGIPDLEIY